MVRSHLLARVHDTKPRARTLREDRNAETIGDVTVNSFLDLFAGEDATMMPSRRSVRLRRDPLALAVGSKSTAFVATSDVAKRDSYGPVAQFR